MRVVGATNVAVSDLKDDLGPRFKVKVEVPPLSKRREDIPLLARHLVLGIARESEHARSFVVEVGGRKDVRMLSALQKAGGNASKAARMLNVGREDFRYQLKARGLKLK